MHICVYTPTQVYFAWKKSSVKYKAYHYEFSSVYVYGAVFNMCLLVPDMEPDIGYIV